MPLGHPTPVGGVDDLSVTRPARLQAEGLSAWTPDNPVKEGPLGEGHLEAASSPYLDQRIAR